MASLALIALLASVGYCVIHLLGLLCATNALISLAPQLTPTFDSSLFLQFESTENYRNQRIFETKRDSASWKRCTNVLFAMILVNTDGARTLRCFCGSCD